MLWMIGYSIGILLTAYAIVLLNRIPGHEKEFDFWDVVFWAGLWPMFWILFCIAGMINDEENR